MCETLLQKSIGNCNRVSCTRESQMSHANRGQSDQIQRKMRRLARIGNWCASRGAPVHTGLCAKHPRSTCVLWQGETFLSLASLPIYASQREREGERERERERKRDREREELLSSLVWASVASFCSRRDWSLISCFGLNGLVVPEPFNWRPLFNATAMSFSCLAHAELQLRRQSPASCPC